MTRRRLPHLYPEGEWLFVTWHLYGSLPRAMYPPAGKMSAGQAFVWMDRYLDTTLHGPAFLRDPDVAGVVISVLREGVSLGFYSLRAFVVMGNHVHALILPQRNTSKVLQWIKGKSAREANKILNRTGEPFWQRESYDHWVRDSRELDRIAEYIVRNPVTAGLVVEPGAYRWSSAWAGMSAAGA